jgi:hypothetical protein
MKGIIMAEKDYEVKDKSDVMAEPWIPTKDFSVKKGDTVNGYPVYLGKHGFYLMDDDGNVYPEGSYLIGDDKVMSATEFCCKYKEKPYGKTIYNQTERKGEKDRAGERQQRAP